MFTCKNCGHSDGVHHAFVGHCLHGAMNPKDGKDCDCPKME